MVIPFKATPSGRKPLETAVPCSREHSVVPVVDNKFVSHV
jgi:hypothetical protein